MSSSNGTPATKIEDVGDTEFLLDEQADARCDRLATINTEIAEAAECLLVVRRECSPKVS
jgi:hypothetical protein